MKRPLKSIAFPESYQYKEDVAPGERVLVYELLIGGGYTGFIDKMGINWYADTFYDFIIDGRRQEKIERSIEMTQPDEYDPPFVAKKSIRFWFNNNSANTISPGVLCSGQLVRPAKN